MENMEWNTNFTQYSVHITREIMEIWFYGRLLVEKSHYKNSNKTTTKTRKTKETTHTHTTMMKITKNKNTKCNFNIPYIQAMCMYTENALSYCIYLHTLNEWRKVCKKRSKEKENKKRESEREKERASETGMVRTKRNERGEKWLEWKITEEICVSTHQSEPETWVWPR